jgi:hypothetical protein
MTRGLRAEKAMAVCPFHLRAVAPPFGMRLRCSVAGLLFEGGAAFF